MQFSVIIRILGLLLMLFSFTQLFPVIVGWIYNDSDVMPFVEAFFALLIAGAVTWYPFRQSSNELRLRDGFLVVILFWGVLGVSGSLPLILSGQLEISVTDAIFESISALTTTGATVITNLDNLPYSILFYRQQLQWLGGMGIIVLAVAILPILGVGGSQLFRAESPGPIKDSKLTPRIKETAKLLWLIYFGFTLVCAIAYKLAGMTWFDAIGHSFSTVAIGGFSTHDDSMGYFKSDAIDTVAIVFMLLSSANFSLHFLVWRKRNPKLYFQDSELRFYLYCVAAISLVCIVYLYIENQFSTLGETVYKSLFQVVSMITTTGFTTSEYVYWTSFLPVLLIFSSFMGGCAGSTAGGMKVVRVLLLIKQGMREVLRLIHPSARISVKLNRKPVPDNVMQAVWGFFSVYIGIFVLFMLLLMASGLDQVTAFSAVAATLNNLGPGLGDVANNYAGINDFAKWLLSFSMLLGRLEIFTLLVVLTPVFWRQ
ncbi:TrkH family potassium uptake protein [Leucothrix pacifica]|uniref:Trk system potassium uptake protein n=1 Tax=Leucothrix pacifica TaxID=1247513 RepID=A0A317CMW9_9GAMM|nr:TrkH family potassium uptake protein [Leucothrix pacifica]PWQ99985.1 potassium transporter [Leucothrix pacifica]